MNDPHPLHHHHDTGPDPMLRGRTTDPRGREGTSAPGTAVCPNTGWTNEKPRIP